MSSLEVRHQAVWLQRNIPQVMGNQDISPKDLGCLKMRVTPIPSALLTAIQSVHWPLDPSSSPPMHYKPIDEMKAIRSKSSNNNPLQIDLVEAWSTIVVNDNENNSVSDEEQLFGLISVALALLGNGYTDEAHDIVVPLSLPFDEPFGYGPSISEKVSPSVKSYASYVHAMAHRKEAFHIGEYDMTGFANAKYWSGVSMRSPGYQSSLPHEEIQRQIENVVSSSFSSSGVRFKEDPVVQEWCRKYKIHEEWNPKAVHILCADVMENNKASKSQTGNGSNDSRMLLQEFAEQVAESELRVLLGQALQNAGYRVDVSCIVGGQKNDIGGKMPI